MSKGGSVILFRTRTPATLFNIVARMCAPQIEQYRKQHNLPSIIAEEVQKQKDNPIPWEIHTWLVRYAKSREENPETSEEGQNKIVQEDDAHGEGGTQPFQKMQFFKYHNGSCCHVDKVHAGMYTKHTREQPSTSRDSRSRSMALIGDTSVTS